MGLFGRKKNKGADDPRVYAFVGLGMMARFMDEAQLNELTGKLPALIGSKCGTPASNVVVVQGHEWLTKETHLADSVNADGTPAFPDIAMGLCRVWLKRQGLSDHVVADLQLLGVLKKGGGLALGTLDDVKAAGADVNGGSILITAWLAFPRSALQR